MAIDDNKVYGLSGAQVKELPGKIEAVKGLAKVLTTADYNWPINSPNSIALWLLEPGIYEVGGELYVWDTSTSVISNPGASGRGAIAIVGGARTDGGVNTKPIVSFAPNGTTAYYAIVNKDTGVRSGRGRFLLSSDVKNVLTSTSTTDPLSAAQGKVLKDMIDALPTGGGVTELTTADYNYPTDNPDGVARWLLDPGYYECGESIKIYYNSGSSGTTATAKFWVLKGSDNKVVIASPSGGMLFLSSIAANGSSIGEPYNNAIVLTASQVVDSLTSTLADLPLSAAQGKALNDKITPISGSSAPTTATVGELGKIYIDTSTDTAYMCVKADTITPEYTWRQITV